MAPETPATAAPAASQLTLQDQVHAVIATLSMPDEPAGLAVAKQWANERNKMQHAHGVTAYAKVAGASWTYYVKQLAIRIGRPPDTRTALPSTPKAEDVVHIDLGPSKLVSRNHAVISYDTAGEHRWKITVLGRNGVKVDEEVFKKDTVTTLRSGSVIEIGGVQMMFVLPDTAPVVAPGFLHKARLRSYVVDEEVPFPQDLFSPKSESGLGSVAVAGAGASAQARSTAVATAAAATATTATTTMKDARSRSNTLGTGGGSAIAPVYQRGVLLELTEDMDYSQDAMKEIKPPYSYALLIAQAILTSDSEQLTLSAIYSFIMQNYSFYRHSNMGWQVWSLHLYCPCVCFPGY